MEDLFVGFICFLLGVLITGFVVYEDLDGSHKVVEQCELTIARDQHCIITAVIDKEGE